MRACLTRRLVGPASCCNPACCPIGAGGGPGALCLCPSSLFRLLSFSSSSFVGFCLFALFFLRAIFFGRTSRRGGAPAQWPAFPRSCCFLYRPPRRVAESPPFSFLRAFDPLLACFGRLGVPCAASAGPRSSLAFRALFCAFSSLGGSGGGPLLLRPRGGRQIPPCYLRPRRVLSVPFPHDTWPFHFAALRGADASGLCGDGASLHRHVRPVVILLRGVFITNATVFRRIPVAVVRSPFGRPRVPFSMCVCEFWSVSPALRPDREPVHSRRSPGGGGDARCYLMSLPRGRVWTTVNPRSFQHLALAGRAVCRTSAKLWGP